VAGRIRTISLLSHYQNYIFRKSEKSLCYNGFGKYLLKSIKWRHILSTLCVVWFVWLSSYDLIFNKVGQ